MSSVRSFDLRSDALASPPAAAANLGQCPIEPQARRQPNKPLWRWKVGLLRQLRHLLQVLQHTDLCHVTTSLLKAKQPTVKSKGGSAAAVSVPPVGLTASCSLSLHHSDTRKTCMTLLGIQWSVFWRSLADCSTSFESAKWPWFGASACRAWRWGRASFAPFCFLLLDCVCGWLSAATVWNWLSDWTRRNGAGDFCWSRTCMYPACDTCGVVDPSDDRRVVAPGCSRERRSRVSGPQPATGEALRTHCKLQAGM